MQESNLPTRPNPFPDVAPFKFFNKKTKETDDVHLTEWIWQVKYVDEVGGTLHQYDFDTNTFHQFQEIEVTRPLIFRMVHAQDQSKPIYTLLFNPLTMKLIHFYRNGMLDNLTRFPRLHVFGYEKKIKGEVMRCFYVILPSGELIITDDMNLIHF